MVTQLYKWSSWTQRRIWSLNASSLLARGRRGFLAGAPCRYLRTVGREMPNRRAISPIDFPCVANSCMVCTVLLLSMAVLPSCEMQREYWPLGSRSIFFPAFPSYFKPASIQVPCGKDDGTNALQITHL